MARGGCGGSATPERGRGDEVGGGRGGEGGRTSRCVLGRRERGASSKNNYTDSPVSVWSDVHRHADDVDPAERLRRLTVVNSVSAGGCASASRASTSSNLGSPLVQSRPYPAPIPPRPVFVSHTCPFISCPCRRFPSPLSLPFLHVLTTAGAPRHPRPLRSPHGAVVDARTAGVFACRRRGRGGGRGECRPLWRLGALPRAVGSQGRRGGGGGTGRRGRAGPLFPHARGRGRPGGCRCRRCGGRQDGQRRKWWWRPSAEAAINGNRGARGRRAGRGVGQ